MITTFNWYLITMSILWKMGTHLIYHIAGEFGGLVVCFATAELKSANISYSHIYVWRSLTEPPNLNSPIFLQWQFWAQPPNLIPTNISSYTVVLSISSSIKSANASIILPLTSPHLPQGLPHLGLGCHLFKVWQNIIQKIHHIGTGS